MNKNNKIWIRLKYTHFPLPMLLAWQKLEYLVRSLINHYPVAIGPGQPENQPVFIISCGRSGTTLMRSMLVAGGQIAIPAETQVIHKCLLKFLTSRGLEWKEQAGAIISLFENHPNFPLWETNLAPAYQKMVNLPEKERSLARIINEVYMTYAARVFPEARVWGDQSPIHTFYLPYVDKIFPEARYMHLLRDGRDVVASLVTRFGNDFLYEAVHRWKISVKRAAQFQKQIKSNQYLEVRYEKLVREPEVTLQKVSNFIGIEYTPRMLDYWKLPTTIEHKYKSFHENLGKPVFDSSIGKWQKVLSVEQQDYVMKNISNELREFGYI